MRVHIDAVAAGAVAAGALRRGVARTARRVRWPLPDSNWPRPDGPASSHAWPRCLPAGFQAASAATARALRRVGRVSATRAVCHVRVHVSQPFKPRTGIAATCLPDQLRAVWAASMRAKRSGCPMLPVSVALRHAAKKLDGLRFEFVRHARAFQPPRCFFRRQVEPHGQVRLDHGVCVVPHRLHGPVCRPDRPASPSSDCTHSSSAASTRKIEPAALPPDTQTWHR